jgi:hypothetical protein
VDARRGDVVVGAAAGVTAGGALVARGETARGRDYAVAGNREGDRIVVGQNAAGDITVRAKGDVGNAIQTLPADCRRVVIDGHTYYAHGYSYYWPYYYGGTPYYQEIYPPEGAVVTNLPETAGTIEVGGTEYVVADGAYYLQEGDHYVAADISSGTEPAQAGTPDAGQAAGSGPAAPAPAIQGSDILNRMGAYLGSLNNFVVECIETAASPEGGGKNVTTRRRLYVSRPNRITVGVRSGEDLRRFWYDGKNVYVYDDAKKVYASVAAPDTMSATFDFLRQDYGMTMPLADLLRPDVADAIRLAAQSVTYVGEEVVDGRACRKLTLMTEEVHGSLWVEADDQAPRPRKIELLYYAYPGQPRYKALIERWDSEEKIDDKLFVFQPPEGAAKIEMVPRDEGESP